MRALKSRYVAVAASAAILGSAALASAGQVAIIQPGSNQAAGELLEPRWLPWLGCWELFADAVGYRETEGTGRRVVCVNPRPDGRGVTMTAHLDGAVAGQDTVLADGRDHPTQESGCEGWQRSLWSADGHRLYNEAASACEGGANRTLAGINMLVESDRWLELQSMSLDGGEHREMVIRHYRRLADSALSDFGFVPMALELTITAATARAAASGPLDIGDVLEIDERLPLEVTEAAILESNSQFSLDSKELIKLADSGLEERVIDLMVAVSFPDRFLVDSGSRSGGGGGGGYAGIGVYGPILLRLLPGFLLQPLHVAVLQSAVLRPVLPGRLLRRRRRSGQGAEGRQPVRRQGPCGPWLRPRPGQARARRRRWRPSLQPRALRFRQWQVRGRVRVVELVRWLGQELRWTQRFRQRRLVGRLCQAQGRQQAQGQAARRQGTLAGGREEGSTRFGEAPS